MIFLDLETQSAADLKRDGLSAYLRDDSTRIMSAVFLFDGTLYVWVLPQRAPKTLILSSDDLWPADWSGDRIPIKIWTGKPVPWEIIGPLNNGVPLVAHNADMFDARIWDKCIPWSKPRWIDTIHLCRAAGYPGGLASVATALGVGGKSEEGQRALKMLYKAKRLVTADGDDEIEYPVGTPSVWKQMLTYNVRDVLMLHRVYEEVGAFGEPDVIELNGRINARGCPVDLRFADVVCDLWETYQHDATDRVAELTDGAITADGIKSPAKTKRWLELMGFPVASIERKYLNELINDPDGVFGDTDNPAAAKVIEVLLTRQGATRATAAKAAKVAKVADADSRCRNMFVYHGAHTGRWSGRDLQLHNMPRGVECNMQLILDSYNAGKLDLATAQFAANGARSDDVLASLMRPIIRAPKGKRLVVVDYAQVEARGVAWLAGEQRMLDVFGDVAKDLYLDAASRLFGRECTKADKLERQVGKQIALGCGYGMGPNKFGATCRVLGVDLAAAGVTPETCVRAFRKGYPSVSKCWYAIQEAAFRAVRNPSAVSSTHKCAFRMSGSFLELTLPSGRKLQYRNARVESRVPWWGGDARPALIYDGRFTAKNLYGGRLVENIVQALCRDLMADAMLRLDGMNPIVLHIHDEIVFEVDAGRKVTAMNECAKAMSEPPEWASGFPLRVSGFVTDHYVKSPLAGAPACEYMNGLEV